MMNRICTGAVMVSLLFAVAAFGQTPTDGSSSSGNAVAPSVVRQAPDENLAVSVLRKRVEGVDWNELTFERVIDWLREQGQINVIPAWTALEIAGCGTDSLVTLSLTETTVAAVLNEAIEQVSPDRLVRYHASGNTIRISAKEDFERKLIVRIYDVTDILFRIPEFYDAPNIDLQQAQQGGGASAATSGQPVFQTSGGGDDEQRGMGDAELLQRMEEIRTLIEVVVEPEFWDSLGGPGSIVPYNRALVIRASVEVHEEIAGFFAYGQ